MHDVAPAWAERARAELRDREHRLRHEAIVAAQCGVAAGLAWLVAHDLLNHVRPFFAPISALIVLSGAAGQRWRRAMELVFGVAVGIALGDALVLLIGVGPIQIAVVVALAIAATVFLGWGTVAVGQAAASAVLVATLAPPSGGIYVERFVDALVGGAVAIAVMAFVLPYNPLTRVQRVAAMTLSELSEALMMTAEALDHRNAALAAEALGKLRAIEDEHAHLRDTIVASRETATIAPIRRRSRPALDHYVDAAVHIERATRNVRVAQRRVMALLQEGEPVPPGLAASLRRLAEAVRTLRRELARGEEPARSREEALAAVRAAGEAYADGVGFSGSVVVAQIRSAATDLLRATGLAEDEADDAVRRAAAPHGRVLDKG